MLGSCDGVNAVATEAAHVAFAMGRALKISVLALVAAEAFLVDFLCGGFGGVEDLGYVAAALNVRLAGTMAAFAGHAGTTMHFSKPGMRIVSKAFRNFLMAGCADICANEVALNCFCGLSAGRLVVPRRSGHCRRIQQCRAQQQHQTHSQSPVLPGSRNAWQSFYWPISMHQVTPLGLCTAL